MWSLTQEKLIYIPFILTAFLAVHITFIIYFIQNRIKNILANLDQCLSEKMKSIYVIINEFEVNTRKNIDKRFSNIEKTLEGYLNLISGLTNQCREHTDELCKLREKIKLTIGKNKLIEEKIDSFISISNYESLDGAIKLTENVNKKLYELEIIVNKLQEGIIDTISFNKNLDYNNSLFDSKHNKIIEQINLMNNNNKSLRDKINNLEKKYKSTECYVKNNELDKIVEEIDILKLNFQKINDELTTMEKMSEITSDSNDTKNLDEHKKSIVDINIESHEQNIFKLYNSSLKDYYIKIITILIKKDVELIELHRNIENKFKEKYPDKQIACPDGFCQNLISSEGYVLPNPKSLHLLSNNYKNSRKFIEIIFCKYFIHMIDIQKNYQYYISEFEDDILINNFNISLDMVMIEDDEPLNEFENYCLKGIYYVLNKRIKTLERFNNSYKIFL